MRAATVRATMHITRSGSRSSAPTALVVAVLFVFGIGSGIRAQSAVPPSSGGTAPAGSAADRGSDFAPADTWLSGRYRLTPSDVVELAFPYVPEFNQTVTVQPDGYITLRAAGELRVEGRTIPELQQLLFERYEPILREPVIAIVLREFEKPYFVAAGEVRGPGKFELRGTTTLTQALALAGGFTDRAKHSQVVIFRRYSAEMLEVKEVNVKRMLAERTLDEDYIIRPGDTVFVPRSVLSKLERFLPTAGLGVYLNPFSR